MTDKYLSCYKERHELCSIFRDRDDKEHHLAGFIENFNESEIIVSHVNQYGDYDGFIWFYRDAIFRIDHGGKYEIMLEKLYNYKEQKHPKVSSDNVASLMSAFLDFSIKNGFMISVVLDDTYFTGCPKFYDDDYLIIDSYNEFGEYDGERMVSLTDILSLTVDDEECSSINTLKNLCK